MRQFSAFGIVFVTVVAGFGVILASTPPARAAEFFRDSFDPAPLPGWGPSPLPSDAWHVANVTTDPCYATAPPNHPTAAASSPNAYAFHYDTSPPAAPLSQCTYDYGGGIGGVAQGFLTSPGFSLAPSGPVVWLHFSTWRQTDGGLLTDRMTVGADWGAGPQTIGVVVDPGLPQVAWETVHFNLSAAAGSLNVFLIFGFDSGDGNLNDFAGWYIDDVLVDEVDPTAGGADTVTFTPMDMAPPAVNPGDTNVLMTAIDTRVDNNTVNLTAIRVDLTGAPPPPLLDADITQVVLWQDDGDMFFNPFADGVVSTGAFFLGAALLPVFPPVTLSAGVPAWFFITYDIAPGATPGHWVGTAFATAGYFAVEAPDAAACLVCPFDTYVPAMKTEIRGGGGGGDNVTFEPRDLAPFTAAPGDLDVLMGGINVSVDANDAMLSAVTINLTGAPPSDADIGIVLVWQDDGNGVFDPFDFISGFGFFVGGTATVPLFFPILVTAGSNVTLWVSYDISGTAFVGDYVGMQIGGDASLTVGIPDTVTCVGCPLDTYVVANKTEIVAPPVDTVTVALTSLAPPSVQQGQLNVPIAALDVTVDANDATLEMVRVDLSGSPPADADVALVNLWWDFNGNLLFDPGTGDFIIASGGLAGGTALLFPFFPVSATVPERFFVSYDIDPLATVGDWVGGNFTDATYFAVSAPDTVVCSTCPFDTYVQPGATEIVAATVDLLTFELVDRAPATVSPGDFFILMGQLNFSVSANTAGVTSVQLNLTGLPPDDADIAIVVLWLDDGDGTFSVLTDTFLGAGVFTGLTTTLFFPGVTVSAGTNVTMWITYDIAAGATVGDFVGIQLGGVGSVGVIPPDTVDCPTCPVDTYAFGAKTEIILATVDTLTFTPVDLAPATVQPGDTDVLMAAVDMDVSGGSVTLIGILFLLSGFPPADADILLADLWVDDGDGAFEPGAGDTLWDSQPFAGGSVAFFIFQAMTGPMRWWLSYDIDPLATVGDFVGVDIFDAANVLVNLPDLVACVGCPFNTYQPGAGARTEIVPPNAPPEAGAPLVDTFADATPEILHILGATPVFDWTYTDPESVGQADFEVRVGTASGQNDTWAPGPAGGPGLSLVYAGTPLLDGVDYYVAVRVHDGNAWSAWNETRFHMNARPPTPTAPVTPLPASVILATPAQNVSWTSGGSDPDGDNVTFDWQVATDAAYTAIVASGSGGAGTVSTDFATAPSTTYYWRVRASDGWEYSDPTWGEWNFTTETPNAPPAATGLDVGGSADILHILSATPLLNWTYTDADGDAQTDHEVRVGTATGLNDSWAPGPAGAAGLNLVYAGSALVDGDSYWFGVRVFDGENWSAWAEVMFRLNTPPPAPTLSTPANNSLSVPLGAVSLSWSSVTDAEGDAIVYDWFVSTNPAFPSPTTGNTATTTASYTSTIPRAVLFWRVRAFDGYEDGAFSEWFTFTMGTVTTGTITVTVRGGNAPLLNATVELRDSQGTVVDTETTGTNGVARFPDMLFGTYTVRATATGFDPGTQSATLSTNNTNEVVTITLTAPVLQGEFPWWVLIIPLILAVLLILFLLLRRRKPKEEQPVAQMPSAAEATIPADAVAPTDSAAAPPAEFPPPPGPSGPAEEPPTT